MKLAVNLSPRGKAPLQEEKGHYFWCVSFPYYILEYEQPSKLKIWFFNLRKDLLLQTKDNTSDVCFKSCVPTK